jgi:hypothetical protein
VDSDCYALNLPREGSHYKENCSELGVAYLDTVQPLIVLQVEMRVGGNFVITEEEVTRPLLFIAGGIGTVNECIDHECIRYNTSYILNNT